MMTMPNNNLDDAILFHRNGQLSQAQAIYEAILKIEPKHDQVLHLLGFLYYQRKNYRRALTLIDKAIEINPKIYFFYYDRAKILQDVKKYNAAIASYDKAISLKPNYAEAYLNRGNILQSLNNLKSAVASYNEAIRIKPDYVEAYVNRGTALQKIKALDAAATSYEHAIRIKPNYPYLLGAFLHVKMQICEWTDLDKNILKLIDGIEHHQKCSPCFPVLSLIPSLSIQQKVAEILVNDQRLNNSFLGEITTHKKSEKIRLGYYSSDFYNHATAHLMAGLFEGHDRSKFEIVAFSFGPKQKDEMQIRLTSAFNQFIDVDSKSDVEIAALSRSLDIDIAIDLKGYTTHSRMNIFAYRAAPIQVNYLGYPGTMSAPYIDYLIADSVLIPKTDQSYYSEKIAYLPNSYQVNDSERKITNKLFTRQELALPESAFVFCCFNNNFKITPCTFDVWMNILKKVDNSVLWLFEDNAVAATNLSKEAERRGIDASRLIFAKRMMNADHLARHKAADLFLDTFIYNAHTTASDALWAGLPVLTVKGNTFASRVAASLLNAIDLPELITDSHEHYESLAVELATNPEKLYAIKTRLEKNRLTTPLFNTALFVQHIEAAYTQMYDRYQENLPPEHIYIA